MIYESESNKVFESLADAIVDYRENKYEGINNAYFHTNSSLGDATIEIEKDMDYWQAKERFDFEQKIYDKKQMEKIMHKNFAYKDFDEMVADLNKIKPCNLSSNETSFAIAQRMFQKILTTFVKAEDLSLTQENQEYISNKLENLLGCKENKVSEKFVSNILQTESINEIVCKENSIEYPLIAVSKLISSKGNDFTAYFNYLTDGGLKESPCGKWIKAQENAFLKNGIEKYRKKEQFIFALFYFEFLRIISTIFLFGDLISCFFMFF